MENAASSWRVLIVDSELCANCRHCLAQRTCRMKALMRIDLDEPPFIDTHRCRGCGVCMSDCPSEAITVQ